MDLIKFSLFNFIMLTFISGKINAEVQKHNTQEVPVWLKKLQEKEETKQETKKAFFHAHLKDKFAGEKFWNRIKGTLTDAEYKELLEDVAIYWEKKRNKWVIYRTNNEKSDIATLEFIGGMTLAMMTLTAIMLNFTSSKNQQINITTVGGLGTSSVVCLGDVYRRNKNFNNKYEHFDAVDYHYEILKKLAAQNPKN